MLKPALINIAQKKNSASFRTTIRLKVSMRNFTRAAGREVTSQLARNRGHLTIFFLIYVNICGNLIYMEISANQIPYLQFKMDTAQLPTQMDLEFFSTP